MLHGPAGLMADFQCTWLRAVMVLILKPLAQSLAQFLLPPCFLRSDFHDAASFKARSLVETMSQDVKHIGLDGEPRIAGCNEKLRYEVQLQVKSKIQKEIKL